jgi:hypothetical protein
MSDNRRLIVSFILGCISTLFGFAWLGSFPLAVAESPAFRWASGLGGMASFVLSVVVVLPMFVVRSR